ncbi:MAG: hypothetical protein M3N41_07980, partial [Acidobacteriota bacterium]|nr:hypothetical protein [Acidobacteriota bacterium]
VRHRSPGTPHSRRLARLSLEIVAGLTLPADFKSRIDAAWQRAHDVRGDIGNSAAGAYLPLALPSEVGQVKGLRNMRFPPRRALMPHVVLSPAEGNAKTFRNCVSYS